jgi:hypothetical protein
MYRAYMSYSQLKEYLRLLEDRELIKYEQGSQLYLLTEKGLRFMNAYDKINELVPSISEGKTPPAEAKLAKVVSVEKAPVFEY